MKRINKRQARKLFGNGDMIIVCAHDLRPDGAFGSGARVCNKDFRDFEHMLEEWKWQNNAGKRDPFYYVEGESCTR